MRYNRLLSLAAASILMILVLSGCATTVAFDVLKPAQVNMAEYKNLAVFAFEPYDLDEESYTSRLILEYLFGDREITSTGYSSNLDRNTAEYLTDQTVRTLTGTDYFNIITPDRIGPYNQARYGSAVTNRMLSEQYGADAVLAGWIEDMEYDERVDSKEKSYWVEATDEQEGHYETEVEAYFVQEVELRVQYNIIDVDSGQILATKYLSGRDSNRTKITDPESFRAPLLEPMYRSIIRGFQSEIRRHLAPYYVREYRSMKSNDADPRFETAEEYIKRSQYQRALDLYVDMWYSSGVFEAGYNAAVLYEVMGRYDSAIALMREVHDKTGSGDAYDQYMRLQRVKMEAEEAQSQF